jgi:hypothetical protein
MAQRKTLNNNSEIVRGSFAAADCNAFAGSWPFRFLGEAALPAMVAKELGAAGITSAWISSLDALFNAEPFTANQWLFEQTAGSSLLQAVPIFNPLLAGAANEAQKTFRSLPHLPAVRVAPGYHGYNVDGSEMRAFLEGVPPGAVVLITVRVQDRRGQPALFQVPDVPLDAVFELAAAVQNRTLLLCGIRQGEVTANPKTWRDLPNLHIETSFLDSISAIGKTCEVIGEDRLHLGTLAPLHYACASVAKVKTSGLPEEILRRICSLPKAGG